MIQNIDWYEITWTADEIRISFQDIFGDGEVYGLPPEDMKSFHAALGEAIRLQANG
jgi:hypothetical protein